MNRLSTMDVATQLNHPARTRYGKTTRFTERYFVLASCSVAAGGLALGSHLASVGNAGFEHVWVNDIDPDAMSDYS